MATQEMFVGLGITSVFIAKPPLQSARVAFQLNLRFATPASAVDLYRGV